MNEAENFFKHADRATDETLDFTPSLTETWLLDACRRIPRDNRRGRAFVCVYTGWFMIGPGASLSLTPEAERIVGPARRNMGAAKGEDRAAFFSAPSPGDATRVRGRDPGAGQAQDGGLPCTIRSMTSVLAAGDGPGRFRVLPRVDVPPGEHLGETLRERG